MNRDSPLAGRRILVLEDDFYLADDARSLLEGAGAEVAGPLGSKAAPGDLDAALPFDAALVDINLGRGPTFEFAHRLEALGIPFVFVTGYDAALIPGEFAGVPRLEKPVPPQILVAAVSRLVADERSR